MSGVTSVSVVIPARNAAATIGATLESVLAQDHPGIREVIVADGSDDRCMSDNIRERFPQVRVVVNTGRNIPAGLNRAIAAASGDVIVRCDAHTILPADYVSRAVAALERLAARGVASVGGRAVPESNRLFGRAVALTVASPVASGRSRYKVGGAAGPSDVVYLGVYRRETWERLGGYNEDLWANEDYEFHWRMRQAGGVVWFDPELQSTYRPRETPTALAAQYFNYGRWKSTMLLGNPRSLRPRQLFPPLSLAGLLASLVVLCVADRLWAGLAFPLFYLALVLAGAVMAAPRRDPDLSVLLYPAALVIMHASWGAGFYLPHLSRIRSRRDVVT